MGKIMKYPKRMIVMFLALMLTIVNRYAATPKIESCLDAILWAGAGYPNRFDPKDIKEGPERQEIIEEGLLNLEKCAKLGSRPCLGILAEYYYHHAKDYRRGLVWYHKAASYGSVEAMTNLRYAYDNGEGVVRDLVEATKWSYLAAALGSENDKKIIDKIDKNDPDYQLILEGQRLAKIWEKEHPHVFITLE